MRFLSITFSALALFAAPALAQEPPKDAAKPDAVQTDQAKAQQDKAQQDKAKAEREKGPGALATSEERLDFLYAKLKKESSTELSRTIVTEIRAVSAHSGSATVDLLMENATRAIGEKKYGAALDFLDMATLLAPDYAEGFNRRATLHFMLGNYPKAMSDSARVLALEPRHLGALAGMAGILQETGRDEQALQAWQSYISYFPADREAQLQIIELMNKLAGQKT